MPNGTERSEVNLLTIAVIYGALIVILMIFFVVLSLIYNNSTYKLDWIPDASKTIIDLVKVTVGAIIGLFTPSTIRKVRNK